MFLSLVLRMFLLSELFNCGTVSFLISYLIVDIPPSSSAALLMSAVSILVFSFPVAITLVLMTVVVL